MDERRRDGRIADIMRTEGPEKYRVLAAKGAPTFLLLEDATGESRERLARPDAEGAALGAMAGEIYRGFSPEERDAWPGGVALALQMLADRSFFPSAGLPTSVRNDDGTFRALAEGRYVRAVNFHATPRRLAGRLEEQLSRLAGEFVAVTHEDLTNLVARGEWPHDRPGVVLSFFDGFRDNFDVVVPILDRLGLIGWFFVIPGWVATPPEDQRSFAARHFIDLPYDEGDLPADGRIALSPGEILELAGRGHVVTSHTRTHATPAPDLPPEALEREAAGSKRELEDIIGRPVRALAWCEGTSLGVNARADEALRDAGYGLLFANHAVQRVP